VEIHRTNLLITRSVLASSAHDLRVQFTRLKELLTTLCKRVRIKEAIHQVICDEIHNCTDLLLLTLLHIEKDTVISVPKKGSS
jgi:hypothetical protein